MEEIWKDIEGYESLYQVSTLGRVRSVKKNKILYAGICNSGYYTVMLYKNGNRVAKMIHRLVAETFLLNNLQLPCVNHKSGIKTENNINNIEWCDESHNMKHALKNGLLKTQFNEKQVIEIRSKFKPRIYTLSMLAEEYKTSRNNIIQIIYNRTWKSLD